jgi:hypothetical protein
MYHNVIRINFKYYKENDIDFDYSFLISKTNQDKFSSINYGMLLDKFNEIGFNLKYLKFNDLDLISDIYCSYNYQENFKIFFSAYNKFIYKKSFNLHVEYGNIIDGIFYQNNMTTFASVSFIDISNAKITILGGSELLNIIKDKIFYKTREKYQIIDKDGIIIATEITDSDSNFEQHFFEKYEVKVALRKYKLSRLMQFEEE